MRSTQLTKLFALLCGERFGSGKNGFYAGVSRFWGVPYNIMLIVLASFL